MVSVSSLSWLAAEECKAFIYLFFSSLCKRKIWTKAHYVKTLSLHFLFASFRENKSRTLFFHFFLPSLCPLAFRKDLCPVVKALHLTQPALTVSLAVQFQYDLASMHTWFRNSGVCSDGSNMSQTLFVLLQFISSGRVRVELGVHWVLR